MAGEGWTMSDGRILESDVLPVLVEGHHGARPLWLWRDVTERSRPRGEIHGHAPEANLSYLDELTGLHNRRGFLRSAGTSSTRGRWRGGRCSSSSWTSTA